MIGDLTFDKSSKDIGLFLYSIFLIGKYGNDGVIRRNFSNPCFVQIMADFMGVNPYKKSEGRWIEERTCFNKSLFAQYYGFIDRDYDIERKELLCLTERGRILYKHIICDEENKKCYLEDSAITIIQDLMWNSILYDSFGRNNEGAQTSKTDVDAPKVIFRLLFDLNNATNEEFFYVLFSLNGGDKGTLEIDKDYHDLIEVIKTNRADNKYDYSPFFNQHHLNNKVNDSKVIDLFSDPQIGIIEKYTDRGLVFNRLSRSCDRFLEDKQLFECWYNPHSLVLHTANVGNTRLWLQQSILNKNIDRRKSIWIDIPRQNHETTRSQLLKAINNAMGNKTYVILMSNSETELVEALGPFVDLIKRKNNYTDVFHGWSEKSISYNNSSGIQFPYNLQFVAIIKD